MPCTAAGGRPLQRDAAAADGGGGAELQRRHHHNVMSPTHSQAPCSPAAHRPG